jgi:hypothetical protein
VGDIDECPLDLTPKLFVIINFRFFFWAQCTCKFLFVFLRHQKMASQFLSRTWDRDRIMGLIQFTPMVLDGPLKALGNKELHASVTQLGALADLYRTVTRCSGLVDSLSTEKLSSLTECRDPTLRQMGIAEHICHLLYFPCEHMGLLHKFGILTGGKAPRFGGLTVFFWFWGLLVGEVRQLYQMLLAYPHLSPKATDAASVRRQAEWRRLVLNLIKNTCFLIFSLTCFPANGKPQLLASPSGVFLPLHRAIEILTPPRVTLSISTRGMLGLIATSVDFI